MTLYTLLLIGGFVPILYTLYAVLQTLRKHPQVNGFGTLLAYAAVLIPVGVFAWGTAQGVLPPLLVMAAVASAAVTLLFGLILLIRDIRQHQVNHSYGLLSIGVSVLIAVGLFATPFILTAIPNATASATANAATSDTAAFPAMPFAQNAAQTTGTTSTTDTAAPGTTTELAAPAGFEAPAGFAAPAGFNAPSGDTSAASPDSASEPDASTEPGVTATPTYYRQAVLPTITPTLMFTATPTPTETSSEPITPTLDASQSCELMVIYNLNLRAEPDASAELLTTIPYSSLITAYESVDGWWHVSYNGLTGWVSGDYVSTMSSCDQ